MAAVVQSEPQQLVLFANRTHKKYLGRRAGTSIVFYDMPKPLIMHLAKLPGTDTKRAMQSIQFIDSVDPAVLPKDPKERWEQLKVLWIKSGATDAGRPDDDLPTQDVVPTPQIREAQLISEDGVHTNKFNFDVEEDSQLELTNVEQVERLQVVQINLGRKLGQLDVPPELQYIRAGTPWRLEGDRDIPVTLILSLKSESDKNPTIVASATYQMVMARSKREYPLHLPEIRKKTATVENALRKHLRKAKSHEVVINEIKQQIAQVARTRIPTNGPGALAAAQQKQAALTGLNETLSKKGIAYKNVMKQVNRSQAQLESFKSIAEFAQDMQSGGWIQVKVFEN